MKIMLTAAILALVGCANTGDVYYSRFGYFKITGFSESQALEKANSFCSKGVLSHSFKDGILRFKCV